jgi:hypothetical protein
MKQLTKQQAIAFYESGQWKDLTHEEIVRLQLFQDKLCVPFSLFHEAVETVLKRPVQSIEFGSIGAAGLRREYLGEKPPPTFEEIIEPFKDKIIFVNTEDLL